MKISLFDWTSEGHHPQYIRRFAEALCTRAEVVAAIPDAIADSVADLPLTIYPLKSSRPRPDFTRPLEPQNRDAADREIELFSQAVRDIRPNHMIHMCGDPVIRRLVKRPSFGVPVSICIFRNRAHYPRTYKTHLPAKELLRAWFLEYLISRWRRRSDAFAVYTLDENAAHAWSRRRGAHAYYLPEPPIQVPEHILIPARQRSGCILYGYLEARKGIDLLSQAIRQTPRAFRVVLAGAMDPGYRSELLGHVKAMEQTGATIELRDRLHGETEGLRALAEARAAILPYPNHYGMSRVLLEAASVGTPIISYNRGLLGYLVERYGLGISVDCADPQAFSKALTRMCDPAQPNDTYSAALARFAARFSQDMFRNALLSPFFGD